MRPLIFALMLFAPLASAQSAADKIRAARAISNKAWADRDLAAYAATITADFVITSGNGGSNTHDDFLALLGKSFPDANAQRCVRTPDTIDLSTTRPLAAEHGHWRCTAIQPDGTLIATGTYMAMWRLEAATWRTRSELFVTLACTGSAACTPKP